MRNVHFSSSSQPTGSTLHNIGQLGITRMAEQQPGFYCSTSGTFFADKVLQAVIVTLLADLEYLTHGLNS